MPFSSSTLKTSRKWSSSDLSFASVSSEISPSSRIDCEHGALRAQVLAQLVVEARHLRHRDRVEVAVDARVDRDDLLLERPRLRTAAGSASRPSARRGRAPAASPGRARSRTARTPPARGTARGRAGAGPRPGASRASVRCPPTRETETPTLIAGRTPEKKRLGLEIDLPVGDRDHVRGDVGRDVAGLRLDDRKRRQRAAAEVVRELARALEQPGVEVEDVAGEGLAAGRASEKKRQLSISIRVLREVVVDEQGVLARCRGSTRPSRSRRTGPST